MSSKIIKKEGTKVELEITISKEKFNNAIDEAFKNNSNKFKIPGFRNGKVPKDIVEKTYGEEIMYEEAFNMIADEEYSNAIAEHNLVVVSNPQINITSIGKDKDVIFTVSLHVKPEITLKKYKGLEIKKVNVTITEKDVENELENIKNKNARIITKQDQVVEKNDIANIDFEGFLDKVPFEGGKAEKYDLEIGSNSFIPGFEEQLIGMKAGEEKEITTTFPKDYGNKDLAGKDTIFKIKLHEVKQKEVSSLDDEFAKDVSEFDTLEEYKQSLKQELQNKKEASAKAEKEAQTIEKLTENVEVDIPEPMIEKQIELIMSDVEQNLSYQGLDLNKYMELSNIKEDELKAQFRDNAIKDIKLKLALEYIQKKEDLTVDEKEIDKKIEELSNTYGKKEEADSLKNNAQVREYMQNQLKQEKVLEFIISNTIEK